jgi:hypothetical protein
MKMNASAEPEKQTQYKPNTNPIQTQYKPNTKPILSAIALAKAEQSQFPKGQK